MQVSRGVQGRGPGNDVRGGTGIPGMMSLEGPERSQRQRIRSAAGMHGACGKGTRSGRSIAVRSVPRRTGMERGQEEGTCPGRRGRGEIGEGDSEEGWGCPSGARV